MSLIPTQPMWTTLPYWAVVLMAAFLAYLVMVEESVLIGAWLAFIFAVILLPAAWLEVH